MAEIQKKQTLQIVIHLIVWGIIFIFPLIFMYSEGERSLVRFMDFSVPLVFLMIVFYSNYLFFISRFLFQKKIWQFFAVNLILFTICLFLLNSIKDYFFQEYFARMEIMKHLPPRSKMKNIIFFRDTVSLIMTVGLAVAIRMTTQWYHLQSEQKELEKLHVESELNNLKHQLNPHFLFNTLNNIYSLISINQGNAQNAVHQLSNLIRYVLYETDQESVPLSKELNFMENYIQLMSLRLPGHVTLSSEIMKPDDSIRIAPLLFISLVENAFKHGVDPVKASFISIRINKTEKGELLCQVDNSNVPKPANDKSGSGIGLANLKKRLDLLYPSHYQLLIRESEDQYTSTLILKA